MKVYRMYTEVIRLKIVLSPVGSCPRKSIVEVDT